MKKSILGMTGLAAISLAIVCIMAASVLAADVSRGQFYTEEEYQKLGGKEREAYCASLASEADRQVSMLGEAEMDLASEQAKIDDLSNTLKQVDGELGPVQADVARLEEEIAEFEEMVNQANESESEFIDSDSFIGLSAFSSESEL